MAKRGPKPQVRWWAKDGGGFYYRDRLLLRCKEDDSPNGPNYEAALKERSKIDRQDAGKGTDDFAVSALLNEYRQFLRNQKRDQTLRVFECFLKSFAKRYGALPVGALRGYHVREWLDASPTWTRGSKRLAVSHLSIALNWGVKDGLITNNPLHGRITLPKEHPRGREARLSSELAELLIANASCEFTKVLRMLRHTGARPEEIEQMEAFNYVKGRIIYRWNADHGHIHKQAKRGKQTDRVIYLTPELQEIVEQEIARHPTGRVFRTPRRHDWNQPNRGEAWRCLLKAKPVAAYIKHHGLNPRHIIPYSFRHTFISQWIDDGRSIKIVADLCGTSVAMIEKHYGHPDEGRLEAMYLDFMATTNQSLPDGGAATVP